MSRKREKPVCTCCGFKRKGSIKTRNRGGLFLLKLLTVTQLEVTSGEKLCMRPRSCCPPPSPSCVCSPPLRIVSNFQILLFFQLSGLVGPAPDSHLCCHFLTIDKMAASQERHEREKKRRAALNQGGQQQHPTTPKKLPF